jgi:hypothetical protein
MSITQYGLWFFHGPGGGFLPLIAGTLVFVCGTIILVRSMRGAKETKEKITLDIRAVQIIVVGTLTLFSMYLVGMIIAIFVFLFCWIKFFEKRSFKKSLAISFGTTVFMHIIFRVLLSVPLPRGLLGIL